jgi:hypothetical protein
MSGCGQSCRHPLFGYAKKRFFLIPREKFDSYEDVLVVRTYQANDLLFNRFLQANRNKLVRIKEFSLKGKRVILYQKKKKKESVS